MKKLFKNTFLFLAFLLWSLDGSAQLYPVQLTPIFNSPYSVKISDYATSMETKMQLLIHPTDISISQRQVRLKLYIQGNGINIQTSDYVQGQRPIFINGGELQTLTNIDISALFRLENMQGITALQYANPLPEGMYSFCFEMYDFITNQKISQKSCASLYLILNDPPLLNTPQRNEQIAATEFPNILFTWTPRQINATNVSYKYELKQITDPNIDPQFGFLMAPLLHEETLFGTALLYNLAMPTLTPGMRYAWRVKAISTTGLSENAVFKNDGYSEIFSFKYTGQCLAPTFPLSEAQGPQNVRITWQGVPQHTRYQIQYKKQGFTNARWFSTNSLNTQSLLSNLEPGVTYEFRVGSSCDPVMDGIQSFTYSSINTFTTPTQTNGVPAYNCGITPNISIKNQNPINNLIESETFTAGDFPVKIVELRGKSPYSGKGYIIVPYLGETKIAVTFDNIFINTDYQLISGIVETSYDPTEKNIVDVKDIIDDAKELIKEITDLFDRANELEKQKANGTISDSDYNKNWKEIYEGLETANKQYKELANTQNLPEDLKEKIADLDPVFIEFASNNFATTGNTNQINLDKTQKVFEEVNKFISEKCDTSLKDIITFLTTEKINYLKLLASESSRTTASAKGTKIFKTSIYDEAKGNLKITHYKGWSNNNPMQNLFLIESKDTDLNKQSIKSFWLSYAPNSVDGIKPTVDVTIYYRDTEPKENEPDYCTKTTTILKGISVQAQFADALGQMVFYSTMGLASVETLATVKAGKCATGFSFDVALQMGLNAIIKKYLNENFTTKQLIGEVSLPSAGASCLTAGLVDQCGTACAGVSGFAVGFGDDVLNQLKSGKSLSEVELSQSTLNGVKLGILNMIVLKATNFGISKLTAWRGKYTPAQAEAALKDLEANPEKYGLVTATIATKNVKDIISKKILKTISKYDRKLNKMVDYPMYNNIALGKSSGGTLKEFGDEVGANVWTAETDNVFTSMYNLVERNYVGGFERSIGEVLDATIGKNQGKILFDITGVNIQKAVNGGMIHNEILTSQGFVTELELQLLMRNKSWYENVIFHEAGKVLDTQEIGLKGIKYIGQ